MDDDNQISGNWNSTETRDSESWITSFVPENSSSCEVVNYYFPVEVVVSGAGGLTPTDRETIQADIFQDLYDAINRRLV